MVGLGSYELVIIAVCLLAVLVCVVCVYVVCWCGAK